MREQYAVGKYVHCDSASTKVLALEMDCCCRGVGPHCLGELAQGEEKSGVPYRVLRTTVPKGARLI
jgi:hypothetical protein